jgi:hypothetical protein
MPALPDQQSDTTADPQRPTDRVVVLLPPWLFGHTRRRRSAFRRVVADARRRIIRAERVSVGAKLRVIRERLAQHYRGSEDPVDSSDLWKARRFSKLPGRPPRIVTGRIWREFRCVIYQNATCTVSNRWPWNCGRMA